MIPGSRWARRTLVAVLFASATWTGCATNNPQGTHEARLLDNKVTAERVHAALRRAGPQFRHVEVTASRDGITLTGKVSSADARSRAEEIAKEVDPGAKLGNHVTVR